MKKYIIILFSAFLALSLQAQSARITLDQKVSRHENRRQLTSDSDNFVKNVSRQKTFTLTVASTTNLDVFVIFFTFAGGEMNCDSVVGKATMAKPFVYTAGASGESEQVNIAFKKYGWGDDFKRFSGNAKVEAAAYVYNRKDGKLLGQKFTSKAFADKIEKKLKTEMQNAANENMLK